MENACVRTAHTLHVGYGLLSPNPPPRGRGRVEAGSGVAGRLKKNARNISTAGIFQVAFIARQMEKTLRTFFQTTFEPISVGRVPQGTHVVGWGCRENGECVRAYRAHPICGLRLAMFATNYVVAIY